MHECERTEIRDVLPDHARGALAGAERARVEAHLASCEACRAELALLRAVRGAHPLAPAAPVDVARIVAALPRPAGTAGDAPAVVSLDAHRARRQPARRGLPWRRIVGVAAVLAGVAGVALLGRSGRVGEVAPDADLPRAAIDTPVTPAVALAPPVVTATTGERAPVRGTPKPAPRAAAERTTDALGALGGVASGATDDELEALIGGLESLSGIPEVEATEAETLQGNGGQG